jgi:hypothetical protein
VVRRLFFLVLCALASRAGANQLIVDHHRMQMNDLLTITLSIDGVFASADEMNIPLSNLALVGEPSVSSEFSWSNGQVTRRKVFRYRARALAPGPARVGPLVLNADGQRDTLPAIAIEVLPDRASGSNDAEVVLQEMLAAGRDPLFVIAEMDKRAAYVGEPVTVTWWLYNAAVVQQWQIAAVPKLVEFWAEELSRNETPERVYIGDVMVQRLPIRRVVLFPLQSGPLRIGGMSVQASVLRRTRRGPLAMFEGDLTETTFTSAPIDLEVRAIPPGPSVDAIGDLALRCEPPLQKNRGPVVVRVTLSGLGNLRAAKPPRFEGAIAGRMQIEGGEVSVARDERSFAMSRQWRFLLFPEQTGMFEVPPLSMQIFDPASGTRRDLRCTTSFVNAVAAAPAEVALPAVKPSARVAAASWPWPWIVAALVLLLAMLLTWPRVRRELLLRREVLKITRDASPAEIRARIEARMPIDLREASERGDAMRALRSLLDAAERDRDIAVDSEREIERRVREVLMDRESRPSP